MMLYEKILILNDTSENIIRVATDRLLQHMFDTNKEKNTSTAYFRLRLKDSEKVVNANELLLEWKTFESIQNE